MKATVLLLVVSTGALAADADLLHCRAAAKPSARLACYDAIVIGSPPAPVAAVTSMPAAAPGATFGLSAQQLRKNEEPDAIESTVIGKLDGWGPDTVFRLANGQVWRVVDGSDGWIQERDNPRVTLRRNGIGTVFFEVEGANQPPRVRRLK